MKTILIIFLAISLISFSIADGLIEKRSTKWIISENSSLIVNGTTNINKFSCVILRYPKTDTVTISQDKTSNLMLSGIIHIEVKNFDCNNMMMTRELRKTLKENEFPFLHIRFVSLKEIPNLNQKMSTIKGAVEIEIAGTTKRFEITYQLDIDKNKMTLTGNQAINFSDFGLQPPKKMGKLVRAKDELKVVFFLKMELAA